MSSVWLFLSDCIISVLARHSTSSKYHKSYLDLGFGYCCICQLNHELDSIAVQMSVDILVELTNTEAKIQITLLIVRRGTLSTLNCTDTDMTMVLSLFKPGFMKQNLVPKVLQLDVLEEVETKEPLADASNNQIR